MKQNESEILFVGEERSGKSSLYRILTKKEHDKNMKYSPTIGLTCDLININDHKIKCWDSGGKPIFKPFMGNHYSLCDIIFIVINLHIFDKEILNDYYEEASLFKNNRSIITFLCIKEDIRDENEQLIYLHNTYPDIETIQLNLNNTDTYFILCSYIINKTHKTSTKDVSFFNNKLTQNLYYFIKFLGL